MNHKINLLDNFLDKLDIIRKRYDQIESQKDQFNIFSILRNNREEVRLHSRFIASLLSWPTNNNYLFLDKFIREIKSNFTYNTDSLEIYPSYNDKREYSDIDILIIDRTAQHAIIIENKIYAPDSNHQEEGQLEKYYRIIVEDEKIPEKNVEVLYLTLDGHEPTDESVSTCKKYPQLIEKVQCISYATQIKCWLTESVKTAYNKPFQRETILQYINLINDMTNHSEQDEQHEILRLIGESESNIKSAKLLIDNISNLHWHILSNFWNGLANELTRRGYTILYTPTEEDYNLITKVESQRKKNQAHLYIDFKVDHSYQIRIEEYNNTWINFGVKKGQRISKCFTQAFKSLLKQEGNEYESEDEFDEFLIWKYLPSIKNDDMNSWDIHNNVTFRLIREDFRNQVIAIFSDDIDNFVNEVNTLVKSNSAS